jgi:L-asparaginase II
VNEILCEFVRGGRVESVHRVRMAVWAGGRPVLERGEVRSPVYLRSCAKPFQALAVLETGAPDAFGFSREEVALTAGSHPGEPVHVKAAASMLRKAGVPAAALGCGIHAPTGPRALERLHRSGRPPGVLHNNCSGKHAGMLAACRFSGWPLRGYLRAGHPLQRRIRSVLARFSGATPGAVGVAIDGCGAPTFALPLRDAARAMAAFSTAPGSAARIRAAMTGAPEMIGRPCSAVMAAGKGRLIAKAGAEGVYVLGVPALGLGAALKVEDGNPRAWLPVLADLVRRLKLLDGGEAKAFARLASRVLRNATGTAVGRIRVR